MKIILVGGFLGSGKTTAIQQAGEALLKAGKTVGVVSIDQGSQLVDTTFMIANGLPTNEVTNGCFCCQFEELDNRIQSILLHNNPDVLFAESVGSCTDLIATVVKPMQKLHPELDVTVCIFADALVFPQMIRGSELFVNGVQYIYRKQMEEADLLVLSKTDLLTAEQLNEVLYLIQTRYPDKKVLFQNSLDPEQIRRWLQTINGLPGVARTSLLIDYDLYAAGEADLAWFDGEVIITSENRNAVKEAQQLIEVIHEEITSRKLSIGHLKFLLDHEDGQEKISIVSNTDPCFNFSNKGPDRAKARLLINARVQTTAKILQQIMTEAFDNIQLQQKCTVTKGNLAAFQPGYPRPTYRIAN